MATNLNPGFTNNINIIELRSDGGSLMKLTDRKIDFDGDGAEEVVTITHVSGSAIGTPSAPGGKVRSFATIPSGVARSVIERVVEPDHGVNLDLNVSEFTEGVQ